MPAIQTSIENELRTVEARYWEALKAADAKAVGDLTADSFTFAMKDGVLQFTRDDYVKMMVGGDFRLKNYTLSDDGAVYRWLGPDVAMSAYRGHWVFERDGKLEGHDTVTMAVWTREGGAWKCAAMSEADVERS